MESRVWSLPEIIAENQRRGKFFFEPDTMRFFRSRLHATVYQGPGGIYFVTSEQFEFRRESRTFTVRRFLPATGEVSTWRGCADYPRRAEAHAAAFSLAGNAALAAECPQCSQPAYYPCRDEQFVELGLFTHAERTSTERKVRDE